MSATLPSGPSVLSATTTYTTLLTGLAIDEAIASYTSAGRLTQLSDQLGSVIRQINEAGSTQSSTAYSPYGEASTTGNDQGNSTEFTGRENDDTGLYFYRARYFDPLLKRWISEDPIGHAGGINVMRYVGGDPVMFVDPDGLSAKTDAAKWVLKKVWDGCKWVWKKVRGNGDDAPTPPKEPKFPDRPLPRDKNGNPTPEPDASGPHTQLGQKNGRNGNYDQAREFDGNGKPIRGYRLYRAPSKSPQPTST